MVMGIENHRKHSLGKRAFLLFLFRKMKLVIFFFAFVAAAWYSERWAPSYYAPFVNYGVNLLALCSVMFFLTVILWTWLEYRIYTYTFTDEAFMVISGYITRTELAALYHQIQNVSIERDPFERIIGVSRIIIFMNGATKDAAHNKIILPAVGKTKAKLVQKELLIRARQHMASNATAENRTE